MARPLIPFVQNGYYASRNWIPLVKGNGFTTSGGGEQEEVWETASGSVVTFDAIAAPLRQLSVAVEPVQNLNGYDNPWPAGGGKNLFGGKSLTQTVNTIACEITSDSALSLNGTNSSSSAAYFTIYPNTNGERYLMKAGTYTFSSKVAVPSAVNITFGFRDSTGASIGVNSAVLTSSAQSVTRTIEQDFEIFCNAQISGGSTVNYNGGLQIESGSSATAWSPYSNICPITGFDSVTVNRTGKNLFDPTRQIDATATTVAAMLSAYKASGVYGKGYYNGTVVNANAQYWTTFTPCKTGVTYTIKNTADTFSRVCFLDDSGNVITISSAWHTSYTHTALSNEKYIMASFKVADVDYVMLNVGSTAEPYSAFVGTTYPIPLGQTVYGGTLDVVNGKMTVDRAQIVLNGTQQANSFNWRPSETSVGVLFPYSLTNNFIPTSGAVPNGLISDKAISCSYNNQWDKIYDCSVGLAPNSNFGISLRIPDPTATTAALVNAYLSANPITVVYPLATPFELTLTPEQISTLQGINNVWSDAGDVTVEYRAR